MSRLVEKHCFDSFGRVVRGGTTERVSFLSASRARETKVGDEDTGPRAGSEQEYVFQLVTVFVIESYSVMTGAHLEIYAKCYTLKVRRESGLDRAYLGAICGSRADTTDIKDLQRLPIYLILKPLTESPSISWYPMYLASP